jgi:AcrR family transcriptional regulator
MARAQPLAPDERRAALLAAAREVFARLGYHAAGVSDIIEAAGVARGTFYNYFESKRAVFQACLESVMESVAAAVRPIDVSLPIEPQVRQNVRGMVEGLLADRDGSRILFADAASIDEDGVEALAAFYGAATARIEKALRHGQLLGVVRDCDAGVVAMLLLGMLKEPVMQALLRGQRAEAGAVVQAIQGLLSTGLLRETV